MKKIFKIAFLMLALVLSANLFAQSAFTYNMSQTKSAKEITYYTAFNLRSTDTLTTDPINIIGLEYAPKYGHYKYNSASAKPKIKLVRQEKVLGTWTDITTVSTSDSLETLRAWTCTDTHTEQLTRFLIIGAAGNPTDTQGWFKFTYYKR